MCCREYLQALHVTDEAGAHVSTQARMSPLCAFCRRLVSQTVMSQAVCSRAARSHLLLLQVAADAASCRYISPSLALRCLPCRALAPAPPGAPRADAGSCRSNCPSLASPCLPVYGSCTSTLPVAHRADAGFRTLLHLVQTQAPVLALPLHGSEAVA